MRDGVANDPVRGTAPPGVGHGAMEALCILADRSAGRGFLNVLIQPCLVLFYQSFNMHLISGYWIFLGEKK